MELSKEQKVMQQVVSKAWNDPSYKAELIANPLVAIKKLTGETVTIPNGKTLQVFDQSNTDVVCFNIPPKPDFDDVELTDSELEAVAGGHYCIPRYIIAHWPPKPAPPLTPTPTPIVPRSAPQKA